MTDKTRNTINLCWSLIPRIFAALGVIGAVLMLVFTDEFIIFPFKWLEIAVPLFMIVVSFAILIIVAWDENQY